MNDWLLILPVLIPMVAAVVGLIGWRSTTVARMSGLTGMIALLLAGIGLFIHVWINGPVATQLGGWRAPIGITFVADTLTALLIVLAGVMGVCAIVFALKEIEQRRVRLGFYPLAHLMTAGVCGSFLTGDLFNLFVWYEVMLMASFVLLALGGSKKEIRAARTYVILNLIGSMIFLSGLGLVYGSVHTLNMADLHGRLIELANSGPKGQALVSAMTMLFLVCFGLKAAAAPLFFWLPGSYTAPPTAVAALFAGLLTKVGVYSLIRATTLVFPMSDQFWTLILIVSGFTMVIGVLGAVAQFEIKRILAFHSISQIGYMLMGLGLLVSPDPNVQRLALASAVLYMIHHSVVKANLFMISGVVYRHKSTTELGSIGGMSKTNPWLAGIFIVTALSLAGIPPLSGFWAKLGVVLAGLGAASWWIVAAALFTGLCTLISMIKIWNEAFWKRQPAEDGESAEPRVVTRAENRRIAGWRMMGAVASLAGLTVLMGIVIEPVMQASFRAADQVLAVQPYLDAVNPANSPADLMTENDIQSVSEVQP